MGAIVKKAYHPPATPCDRLLAHAGVEEVVKTTLRTQRGPLDPVELLHRIRQGQSALAALSTGEPSEGPRWFIHGHPHVDQETRISMAVRSHVTPSHFSIGVYIAAVLAADDGLWCKKPQGRASDFTCL